MGWEDVERSVEKGPVPAFLKIGGIVLFIVIVCAVVGFVLNPFRQAGRIMDKTIDADNVIYNYEWFKQRHQDIEAIDSKIADADATVEQFKVDAGPRDGWHREDREEHSRLSSVALGLKQQRADLAAEYNARSMMVNRSIFKAGDVELPEHIQID